MLGVGSTMRETAHRDWPPTGGHPSKRSEGQPRPSESSRRRWPTHVIVVAWLLLVAAILLAPALIRGPYLGPYHLLAQTGLLQHSGAAQRNLGNSDLVTEMIPWSALTWTQVHTGHLPLWNPMSGLGMPLAFNWQSAPFSLPSLVGYLVPMQLAFTVSVIVTLLVAGTGTYVFGRVLGLGTLVSVMGATFFELSGPFLGWLGFPLGAVISWIGWLLAASVLVTRGRRPAVAVALFAVVLAFAIYAGNPESLAVVLLAVGLFLVVTLICRVWREGPFSIVKPALWLACAVVAGLALASPLLLPALQLTSHTTRVSLGGHSGVPFSYLTAMLLPNGFKVISDPTVTTLAAHFPSTIGFIALPLAVAAVVRRWRDPVVLALATLVVVFGLLVFVTPVETAFDVIPQVGRVYWSRALMPASLGLSVLAGYGADSLLRRRNKRATLLWCGAGFVGLSAWLGYAWTARLVHLPPNLNAAQNRAFLWPAIDLAVGIVVVGILLVIGRRSFGTRLTRWRRWRWAAAVFVLFGVQTGTLLTVGSSYWESSSTFLPTNNAVAQLQSTVGTGVVGLGATGCALGTPLLGLPQETNVAYGVHLIGIYDPIIPKSYFSAWQAATGESGGNPALASFCPAITSASVAREFGIAYVLTGHGIRGPVGGVFLRTLRTGSTAEDLYRIPGAGPASVIPAAHDGAAEPGSAGTPVPVTSPNPSTWRLTTEAKTESELRLHLTDVPGWRATIDGRPLRLDPYAGVMLKAHILSGRHTIVVTYWPPLFSAGLILALVGAVVLFGALVIEWSRSRRPPVTPERVRR